MTVAPRHDKPASNAPVVPMKPASVMGAASRAPTMTRAVAADPATARALVISVVRRIEGYLDEENTALDAANSFDFKLSNDRKSQGLVDHHVLDQLATDPLVRLRDDCRR